VDGQRAARVNRVSLDGHVHGLEVGSTNCVSLNFDTGKYISAC
jgi:hypothetical protein